MSEMSNGEPIGRKEAERQRLLDLRAKQPSQDESIEPGVLLSDVILHYCQWFDLILPFDEKNLKPACYKLTIGDEYAIAGKIYCLPDRAGSNEIRIPPFAVAIFKTNETINMPPFLIGRWNIQVSKAYRGLVWVGGPQVDAGYVGHLFCPIYNLSDKEAILHRGDPIAVIDFEKTTTFHEGKSKPYPPLPENILFEDYQPKYLGSGLVKHAAKIEEFERKMMSVQERVDMFVTVTFAVVAILFAALAVSPFGKASPPWQYISVFILSGSAVFFASWAWVRSQPKASLFGRVVQAIIIAGLAFAFVLHIFWIRQQGKRFEELSKQIQELKMQSVQTTPSIKTAGPPVETGTPASKEPAPNRSKP